MSETQYRVVWRYTAEHKHFPRSVGWEDSNSDHHPYTEAQAYERAAEMRSHREYLKVEDVRVQTREISDWCDAAVETAQ